MIIFKMTVQMSVAVSSEQRLTLTNMVLVAILGASVDKSHSTKSSNKSRKHLNDSQPSLITLLHNSQAPLNSIVPTSFEDDPRILVSSPTPLEFQQIQEDYKMSRRLIAHRRARRQW